MITGNQLAAVPAQQITPAQSIVLDWHDGPREGFLRLDYPPSTWYFRLYAQNPDPEDLDNRLFLLAPVPDDTMDHLLNALRPLGASPTAFWTPLWRFPDEASQQHAEATVAGLVGRSGEADVMVESRDLTQIARLWPTVPPAQDWVPSSP